MVGAWSGPDGVLHPIAEHNLLSDATWFFPALTVGRLASASYLLSFVGPETLNNATVVHISAVQQLQGVSDALTLGLVQRLSRLEIYLDPSTALPVAIAFKSHPDANASEDIPMQITFSGYRSTAGIQVPFQIGRYVNNDLVLDLQIENAAVNSGLSSTSFQF
jgi:hypothetical protein